MNIGQLLVLRICNDLNLKRLGMSKGAHKDCCLNSKWSLWVSVHCVTLTKSFFEDCFHGRWISSASPQHSLAQNPGSNSLTCVPVAARSNQKMRQSCLFQCIYDPAALINWCKPHSHTRTLTEVSFWTFVSRTQMQATWENLHTLNNFNCG